MRRATGLQNQCRSSPSPSILVTQRPQICGCVATAPTSARCCQQRTHFGLVVGVEHLELALRRRPVLATYILLIEDNPGDAVIFREKLNASDLDYKLATAKRLSEGLDRLREAGAAGENVIEPMLD